MSFGKWLSGTRLGSMAFGRLTEPLSRTGRSGHDIHSTMIGAKVIGGQYDTAMSDSTTETTQTAAPWWQRLATGLKRSSSALGGAIAHVVAKRQLDEATIEEIEDALIRADLGTETAGRIATELRYGRFNTSITADEIKQVVAGEVEKALASVAQPLNIDPAERPFVILVAGDTFRAAAIEQLKIWADRTGAAFMAREPGADAAGLAFDAVAAAKERGIDVLLIDTAGRLQNRSELMCELQKVVRVIKKVDDSAPHATLLVLDATVGQNALSQVDIFKKDIGVTGLAMTKLDGTARGGILVAIAAKFQMPVH